MCWISVSGTEEIHFATFHLGVDGGIEVTASHNPMDYNGMKLVREGARPISGDTGLRDVQRLAEANDFPPVDETKRGRYQQSTCVTLTLITCSVISMSKTSRRSSW